MISSRLRPILYTLLAALAAPAVYAGEADLNLPDLKAVQFSAFGGITGYTILYLGLLVCIVGALFGVYQYGMRSACPFPFPSR